MFDDLLTHKISTVVSWVLSTYSTVRYFSGRQPFSDDTPYHVGETPFTLNIIVTMAYWGLLIFMQILFVTQIFIPVVDSAAGVTNRLDYTKKVGWHFTAFNFFVFLWTMLFVILVLNLVNIFALYTTHKTYAIKPLGNYFLIHMTNAALPMSWLLFAIFWNGAVLFHVHKFLGRVIANFTVWLLLIIPGFFTLVFNDWGLGLTSSILAFGLGLGQLFTKAFALQWIFGFVISGLLLILTLLVATGRVVRRTTDSEAAPLLE
ncbi:DUF1774-domain-containing protein [Metschnikowia bicuspidata var. bicuspidata NRRL YB-4993]|uniref:DUF1774-domain-containing protein n=1 Tax=Metschnikowia bicuspidata var. bicuspidata NRRL YB-4993 TaxID=869754 RepID=A0A1A0H7Q4_9ASCO|nr:DUF1774-domain-containing protein [Metschnikowia bicuspidata var. bicuspidata NRRL YB-4993]OBA20129.1 DUF1774-domain-containing protein [Metschnikowia bicuspidata var. bicuspidata NRRL YB-4993]